MYAKLIVEGEKCFAAGKMTVAFARQPIGQRLLKGASANSNRKKVRPKKCGMRSNVAMQIVSICSNQIEIYRKVEEDQRADDDICARRYTQEYNKSNNKALINRKQQQR